MIQCSLIDIILVHGFADATYFVVEDEILNTTFRFNVKGMTNFPITISGMLFPLTIEGEITAMGGPTTSEFIITH